MILRLYTISESNNVVNKKLGDYVEINIFATSSLNIINPLLTLEELPDNSLMNFNYCHIRELNRYYFIDSIENVNAKIFNLNCSCDVLMTYKDAVLQLDARVYRNVKDGDFYNAEIITNVDATIIKINSNAVLDLKPTLLLTTVGAR